MIEREHQLDGLRRDGARRRSGDEPESVQEGVALLLREPVSGHRHVDARRGHEPEPLPPIGRGIVGPGRKQVAKRPPPWRPATERLERSGKLDRQPGSPPGVNKSLHAVQCAAPTCDQSPGSDPETAVSGV